MPGVLARGDGTVMTVLTGIRGLAVVDGLERRQPTAATGMAGFAQIGGDRMVARFARGHGAVVATLAAVSGLTVIDGTQGVPVVAGMTSLTHIAGDGMSTGLKGGATDPIVTAGLGTGLARHQAVVEGRA